MYIKVYDLGPRFAAVVEFPDDSDESLHNQNRYPSTLFQNSDDAKARAEAYAEWLKTKGA